MRSENDIYDLADQFEEDLAGSYCGDEFYGKAVRILSEHGYELEEENILEMHPEDNYQVEEYLEVVGKFSEEGGVSSSLKFVLEDSRQEDFSPEIEFVADLDDLTDLPRN